MPNFAEKLSLSNFVRFLDFSGFFIIQIGKESDGVRACGK